ncbi:MAG: arginine biosynthesis bifunctional protein ArgJ [Leptospiraceae bacterium]|nr:MAG: arginine biosynthesis bifunctional protein ArgJ [Leptospiraceae bacterium]
MKLPKGYFCNGWHSGIKKDINKKDFGFIFSEIQANAFCVFTRNKFVGNPIIVGREHIKDGKLQCIIVNSGNSNVATGKEGLELAYNSCKWTAQALNIKEQDVLPSSTGVIGRKLNPDIIKNACFSIKDYLGIEPDNFSNAILTTDQFPKTDFFEDEFIIAGFAKGAGMIHPNMATMLAYIITDAKIESEDLQNLIHFIVNKTFNRISVDSDTSTSDTFAIMANGLSNIQLQFPQEVLYNINNLLRDPAIFNNFINCYNEDIYNNIKLILKQKTSLKEKEIIFLLQLYKICLNLSKKIVLDGEGATKIFRVNILNAPDYQIAERIGRSIINSPLIKTAIFGGDPNWGRFIMAIGKVFEEKFDIDKIKIYCNNKEFYPANIDIKFLEQEMQKKEIYFDVDLNQGNICDSFWGCDLTYDYVKLNSEYTT